MEERIAPPEKDPADRRGDDDAKTVSGKYLPVSEATADQRVGMVKDIFATVTSNYDFLNHFLSLRRDVAWRRFAVKKMRFLRSRRFLDVATGTADLAIDAGRRRPDIAVTGLDFVKEMLDVGAAKVRGRGLKDRIDLLQGDAVVMPFGNGTFDVAAIAFGIRNIPDRLGALREMARVVMPGGQVMVLEMSFTRNWFSMLMYRTYLNRVLPLIAKLFSLNPGAYYYLADSIMNFPPPREFTRIMEEAGLVDVKAYKLTLGVTYLYVGVKKDVAQT
jgi:demethylmenaquinone methyltransferase / 2-methoxy-6-polyprenyl-1,4-benzoquinol methylase